MARFFPADAEIQRLCRYKRTDAPLPPALGPELVAFFKTSVQKRQTRFGKIADCWQQLVPATLCAHCALESFAKGSLVVLVDSASHLYELRQLLLAGLEQQLLIAAKSAGLRKISLRRGQWYDAEERIRFEEPGRKATER